jgi:hypothetical protein
MEDHARLTMDSSALLGASQQSVIAVIVTLHACLEALDPEAGVECGGPRAVQARAAVWPMTPSRPA